MLGNICMFLGSFYSHRSLCQRSRTTKQRANKTGALGKHTSICWALAERFTQFVCWKIFFPHSKSILASGLPLIEQGSPTVSLLWLLEQITGPEKVASSILNKTTQDLQSVNPWKALQFHSLTCLINMEIVKMFWLVKIFFSLLTASFGPNTHQVLTWHA